MLECQIAASSFDRGQTGIYPMSFSLLQPPTNAILIHALWPIRSGGDSLSPAVWDRLPKYLTRYAQTLGVTIYAVGGMDDHVHLLLDLPASKTLDSITGELQKAVARFLKDALSLGDFAWDRPAASAHSVSIRDFEEMQAYVQKNAEHHSGATTIAEWENEPVDSAEEADAMPAWLRNAMPPSR